jgi:outer membrane scaffolding protein for murein synthesis (MipA/OmpV family)
MKSIRLAFLIAASCPAFALPALAQEEEEQHSTLTIGAGAAYIPSYEGSDDYRAIPLVQARGKLHDIAFWTRGPNLYVDLIPNRDDNGIDLEAGPMVYARLDRTMGIKDPQVRSLGKLDAAIEVGGFVGIGKAGVFTSDYDNLSARVSWAKDVAGAHGSYVITPTIEYVMPLSPRTFVGASVSADYVGKGYGRYYFDVTPAGSLASGLPAYDGAGDDSGFKKVGFNISAGQSLSGDLRHGWAIFAVGGYLKLLGDYKRSPVVDIAGSSNQWVGAVGIGYTF